MSKIKHIVEIDFQSKNLDSIKKEFQRVGQSIQLDPKMDDAAKRKLLADLKTLESATTNSVSGLTGNVDMSKLNQQLEFVTKDTKAFKKSMSDAGITGKDAFNVVKEKLDTTSNSAKVLREQIDKFGESLVNTARWKASSLAISTVTSQMQQAIGFTKSLDSSLNSIQIVSGKSSESMQAFGESANKAAQDLKVATTAYTDAALIFYQQGLGDDAVKILTEATIKGAQIAGMTADEMSGLLTSSLNGYKKTANEVYEITDVLAQVGAKSAADFGELATGLAKVSSMGKSAGIGFEELTAQIATIVSVTKEAPESVGTSLKTIYGRMLAFKNDLSGEMTDLYGETFSAPSVEKALEKFNAKAGTKLSLFDVEGNLRDTGKVLNEIGDAWQDVNDQAAKFGLATALAGSRQQNRLLALFNSWDQYQDLIAEANAAEGTTNKQNLIYLNSVQAKMDELKASQEAVFMNLLNSDDMKGVYNLLIGLTKVMNPLIDAIGGLRGVFASLAGGAATLLLNKIQKMSKNAAAMKLDLIATKNSINGQKLNFNDGPAGTGTQIYQTTQKVEQLKHLLDDESAEMFVSLRDDAIAAKASADHLTNSVTLLQDKMRNWDPKDEKMSEAFTQISRSSTGKIRVRADHVLQQISNLDEAEFSKDIISQLTVIETKLKDGKISAKEAAYEIERLGNPKIQALIAEFDRLGLQVGDTEISVESLSAKLKQYEQTAQKSAKNEAKRYSDRIDEVEKNAISQKKLQGAVAGVSTALTSAAMNFGTATDGIDLFKSIIGSSIPVMISLGVSAFSSATGIGAMGTALTTTLLPFVGVVAAVGALAAGIKLLVDRNAKLNPSLKTLQKNYAEAAEEADNLTAKIEELKSLDSQTEEQKIQIGLYEQERAIQEKIVEIMKEKAALKSLEPGGKGSMDELLDSEEKAQDLVNNTNDMVDDLIKKQLLVSSYDYSNVLTSDSSDGMNLANANLVPEDYADVLDQEDVLEKLQELALQYQALQQDILITTSDMNQLKPGLAKDEAKKKIQSATEVAESLLKARKDFFDYSSAAELITGDYEDYLDDLTFNMPEIDIENFKESVQAFKDIYDEARDIYSDFLESGVVTEEVKLKYPEIDFESLSTDQIGEFLASEIQSRYHEYNLNLTKLYLEARKEDEDYYKNLEENSNGYLSKLKTSYGIQTVETINYYDLQTKLYESYIAKRKLISKGYADEYQTAIENAEGKNEDSAEYKALLDIRKRITEDFGAEALSLFDVDGELENEKSFAEFSTHITELVAGAIETGVGDAELPTLEIEIKTSLEIAEDAKSEYESLVSDLESFTNDKELSIEFMIEHDIHDVEAQAEEINSIFEDKIKKQRDIINKILFEDRIKADLDMLGELGDNNTAYYESMKDKYKEDFELFKLYADLKVLEDAKRTGADQKKAMGSLLGTNLPNSVVDQILNSYNIGSIDDMMNSIQKKIDGISAPLVYNPKTTDTTTTAGTNTTQVENDYNKLIALQIKLDNLKRESGRIDSENYSELISNLKEQQETLHEMANFERESISTAMSEIQNEAGVDLNSLLEKNDSGDILGWKTGAVDDINKALETIYGKAESLNSESLKTTIDNLTKSLESVEAYGEEWFTIQDQIASNNEKVTAQIVANNEEILESLQEKYEDDLGSIEALVEATEDLIKQQKEEAKERIENLKKEVAYLREIEDFKKKSAASSSKIAAIEKKIALVSLDTSQTGISTKLQLEEELVEAKLEQDELYLERTRDLEDEGYDSRIESLDDYLSESGTITNDAMEEINKALESGTDDLYRALVDWNRIYGTGLEEDITGIWEAGIESVLGYGDTVGTAMDNLKIRISSIAGFLEGEFDKMKAGFIITQMELNSSAWYTASDFDKQVLANQNQALASMLNAIQGYNLQYNPSGDWYNNGVKMYDNGGMSTETHMAMLHGTSNEPEWIFNNDQLKKVLTSTIAGFSLSNPFGSGQTIQPVPEPSINTFDFSNMINIEGNVDEKVVESLKNSSSEIVNSVIEEINRSFSKRGNRSFQY